METNSDPSGVTPPEFALHWAKELGEQKSSLAQLKGGINNQVFRCGRNTPRYVIKGYASVTNGERDRMQAEVEFLRYAGYVAPSFVPALLHEDKQRRCLVLEHISGASYATGTKPSCSDIGSACAFLRHLNQDLVLARKHVSLTAAEGFLRITEHLENIEQRLTKMTTDHLAGEQKTSAVRLLGELFSRFSAINTRTRREIQQGEFEDAISPDSLIISPSDFGFHNAIKEGERVRFIDFEFAGWDDPVKTLTDFVQQPNVRAGPYPQKLATKLLKSLSPISATRLGILGPILRLKWLCIILSILQPSRLAQILATHATIAESELVANRLDSAAKYLAEGEVVFGNH